MKKNLKNVIDLAKGNGLLEFYTHLLSKHAT